MDSKLFNLKTIMESNTQNITLLNKTIDENRQPYMFSSMTALKEFNDKCTKLNKELYGSILEAGSTAEENNLFCSYFDGFKDAITKFTSKVNEIMSRFRINTDNFIDANKDMINDDDLITNFSSEFTMNLYRFSHLTDDKYPKFCPMKIYKKEFDQIGSLMQQLDPLATNVEKMKIISTVYNSFVKDLNHKWNKKCIDEILDDCDCDGSFAEKVFKCLKSEEAEETTVTKAIIYNAKESLLNYNIYVDSIIRTGNHLIACFNKIADEIGDMIFRNKDGKLCIRTTTDGIADRDYLLDTYSMNNLDIFMKAKINQISELCNLYVIALSIKQDVIFEFLCQNKDILDQVKVSDEVVDDEEMEEVPEDDTDEDIPEDSEEPESDNEPEESEEPEEEPESGEEPETNEEPEKEDDDDVEESSIISSDDYFNEGYIFEYTIFNYERLLEQEEIQSMVESMLLEAEEDKPAGDNTNSNATSTTARPGGNQDLANVNKNALVKAVDWFVEKIKELFRKFYDFFINKTEAKIDFIKENQGHLNDMMKDGAKFKTLVESFKTKNTFHPELLNTYAIRDLNYNSMKESLEEGEKSFVSKFVNNGNNIVKEMEEKDVNLVSAVKNTIIAGPDETTLEVNTVNAGVKFCLSEYKGLINQIKAEVAIIDRAKTNAKNIANTVASPKQEAYSLEATKNEYFNEVTEDETKKDEVEKLGFGKSKNSVQLYFKVSSQILSAKMTAANAIFNEYYMIIASLLKKAGIESKQDKSNKEENKQDAE